MQKTLPIPASAYILNANGQKICSLRKTNELINAISSPASHITCHVARDVTRNIQPIVALLMMWFKFYFSIFIQN